MSNYISAEAIAEDIGVTSKTVREWLKSGELVGIKVGNSWRVHRADFDRYIEGQRLELLLKKAAAKHPDIDWVQGQCAECGQYMATPNRGSKAWVCSPTCKTTHDDKWATIVGRYSEDFAYNCASVVPYF
ncbi:MAG: helix-turn-helix domain-containing protein [Hyphomicrobiales bacterium]|uniref:helix-turn-helix domain-containing protein n=1 Tax=Tateyamaria sp. TaxID=1929288 RepID=UPI00329CE77D